MPDLNERKITSAPGCHNCKHCTSWIAHHRVDRPDPARRFCFVDGVPEDDINHAVFCMARVLGWENPEFYTPELIDVMKLDLENPNFRKTPRLVEGFNRCQFWEQGEEEKPQKELTSQELNEAPTDYFKRKEKEDERV